MFGFTKSLRTPIRILQTTVFAATCCLLLTGCVGPMACGPAGCDANGPIAMHGSSCGGGCSTGCDGCGELYIDPWINHPADNCDPCDQCGNYNGQSCGKCRSVFSGVKSLWGYRCGDDCGGCDSCEVTCGSGALFAGGECGCGIEACGGCSVGGCDSGCDSCGGGVTYLSGEPTMAGETIVHENPSANGKTAVSKPYAPERTKKIFRNRQAANASMPPKGRF